MLYFGDRVAVINDFLYQIGGSIRIYYKVHIINPCNLRDNKKYIHKSISVTFKFPN
jgi:hypothetical protein